jgi:hypothetical protein
LIQLDIPEKAEEIKCFAASVLERTGGGSAIVEALEGEASESFLTRMTAALRRLESVFPVEFLLISNHVVMTDAVFERTIG